jgi:hypothetical protein
MPEAFKGLGEAYLPDPDAVRRQAKQLYHRAAGRYEEALKQIPKRDNRRWAYGGQAAAAYVALYHLDPDDIESLKQAQRYLDEAIEDKASSPYLQPLTDLRELLPS